MSKFKSGTVAPPPPPLSVIKTVRRPKIQTAEGGAGWARDAKSELFLLAVTNMVSEQTFYEKADDRDARFRSLVAQVAREDPDWVARFVPYLRNTLNMRSASVVLAAELVANRLGAAGNIVRPDDPPMHASNRAVIASALQRADEPAEMLGYWRSRFGHAIPRPVRRGVADAAVRLFDERAFLKYGAGEGIRMADVLEITHPKTKPMWQNALFRHMLGDRHHNVPFDPEQAALLPTVAARHALSQIPPEERTAAHIAAAEWATWEWASAWYGRALDADFWRALEPKMGYMARLRNLRNFDDVAMGDEWTATVAAKLADPDAVAHSRQLPLRFLSAYKTAHLRWHYALEQAVNHALANVPVLPGKTLILLDNSGSMNDPVSAKSAAKRRDVASVFAAALALRAENATVVAYADVGVPVPVPHNGSVLPFANMLADVTNGGTRTIDVLQQHYDGHDRTIILTDEQAFAPGGAYVGAWGGFNIGQRRDVKTLLAAITTPIYTFNLAGYRAGHLPSGEDNRYTFGGLTDAGFTAIAALEGHTDADWPF